MKELLQTYDDLPLRVLLLNLKTDKFEYKNYKAQGKYVSESDDKAFISILKENADKPIIVVPRGSDVIRFKAYRYIFGDDLLFIVEYFDEASQNNKIKKMFLQDNKPINFDKLTGLYNTEYFYTKAEEIFSSYPKDKKLFLVYFNVDNFKSFNSTYGYDEGDIFLQNLAKIISATYARKIVARTSDDHFVVLTDNENIVDGIEYIHSTAHSLQKDMAIEVKAGIYEYEQGKSIAQAHDRAKLACDTIKGDYSKIYCVYEESLRNMVLHEKYIVDNLDKAIQNEYLQVHYQPITRVFNNKICSMESLVRWNDPELGFLSPGEFIPVLEKHRLIHKVDAYVIDRVCRDLLSYRKMGAPIVPCSVNLSRLDFQLCDIFSIVNDTMNKYELEHSLLHLEITESALSEEEGSLNKAILKFQKEGYEIWLDDFGSEYSTLNVLQNYYFNVLKIDLKFFSNFGASENASTIIMAIVDMAKRLHMHVLAEGIETKEQLEFLKKVGCDNAQGFYLCRPKPLDAVYSLNLPFESREEGQYYADIGKVNFLSPNPIEDNMDNDKLYNVVPSAIVQLKDDVFSYLYANSGFMKFLETLEVQSLSYSEGNINDDSAKLKTRLLDYAHKAHWSKQTIDADFVFMGNQISVKAKEIACYDNVQAFYVTALNLSVLEDVRKRDKLEMSLNFLYSIYDRVDLIDATNDCVENIYLSSQCYQTEFDTSKNVMKNISAFAEVDIASGDRKKFLEFYDVATLPERIAKSEKGYITQPLRTLTVDGIRLQLYMIIDVNDGQSVRYLSCVRDIELDKSVQYEEQMTPNSVYNSRWYKIIANELKASVFEYNMKTGEAYASSRFYKYDLSKVPLIDIVRNKGDMNTFYPEDLPIAEQFFNDTRKNPERAESVLRLKMMDGTYRWSRVISMFQYDEKGNKTIITGVIFDIEQETNNLEQAKFLNMMPTALGVFAVRGGAIQQLFMNDGYFKLVEDTREARAKLIKGMFINSIHPDDRQAVFDAMNSVIRDGKDECSANCRVITGKGEYKWIKFSSSVASREDNVLLVYSTYVAIVDITNNPKISVI